MKEISAEEYQWLVANVRHYLNHEGEVIITLYNGEVFVGESLKDVVGQAKLSPTPNE